MVGWGDIEKYLELKKKELKIPDLENDINVLENKISRLIRHGKSINDEEVKKLVEKRNRNLKELIKAMKKLEEIHKEVELKYIEYIEEKLGLCKD